jgi:hypothetical protein
LDEKSDAGGSTPHTSLPPPGTRSLEVRRLEEFGDLGNSERRKEMVIKIFSIPFAH